MYREAESWVREKRVYSPYRISIIQVSGVFDLLHPGHIDILQKAQDAVYWREDKISYDEQRWQSYLVVTINSDESVRRIKGPSRPVYPQEWRKRMLQSLEIVDKVFVFEEDTPEEIVKAIKPDYYIKGKDWEGHELPEIACLWEQINVLYMDTVPIHTSDIIENIKADRPCANLLTNLNVTIHGI